MNYLAHIYLSGDNPDLKIGNFMADSIKGRQYLDYPKSIQKGILLHRSIDYFSDKHPIFRKSTSHLHTPFGNYGHYSGVLVDMFYDHFLAKRWTDYSSESLNDYTKKFYHLLEQRKSVLTKSVTRMLPIMVAQDWLCLYADLKGLRKAINQMNNNTRIRIDISRAVDSLEQDYSLFESEFVSFFPEITRHCKLLVDKMLTED